MLSNFQRACHSIFEIAQFFQLIRYVMVLFGNHLPQIFHNWCCSSLREGSTKNWGVFSLIKLIILKTICISWGTELRRYWWQIHISISYRCLLRLICPLVLVDLLILVIHIGNCTIRLSWVQSGWCLTRITLSLLINDSAISFILQECIIVTCSIGAWCVDGGWRFLEVMVKLVLLGVTETSVWRLTTLMMLIIHKLNMK